MFLPPQRDRDAGRERQGWLEVEWGREAGRCTRRGLLHLTRYIAKPTFLSAPLTSSTCIIKKQVLTHGGRPVVEGQSVARKGRASRQLSLFSTGPRLQAIMTWPIRAWTQHNTTGDSRSLLKVHHFESVTYISLFFYRIHLNVTKESPCVPDDLGTDKSDCVYMQEHDCVTNVSNEDWIHVNRFIRSASPKGSSQDRISEADRTSLSRS